jgi:hypothetical protein
VVHPLSGNPPAPLGQGPPGRRLLLGGRTDEGCWPRHPDLLSEPGQPPGCLSRRRKRRLILRQRRSACERRRRRTRHGQQPEGPPCAGMLLNYLEYTRRDSRLL